MPNDMPATSETDISVTDIVPNPRQDASAAAAAIRLATAPEAESLGRHADSPASMPWPGWRAVIRRTAIEMLTDRVSLTAAGCAFFATLALFPAISMLISLYGLVFDPVTVEPQLEVLRDLLPPSAFTLIAERVHMLVTKPPGTLGWSLGLSTGLALWSSMTGIKSILSALNLAYEERECRSFLRFQLVSLLITVAAMLSAVIALGLLVALPAVLSMVGTEASRHTLLRVASFALLVLTLLFGLSLIYRYGPSRERPRWRWVTPGSLVATVLWVAASALFSFYVGHLASYDATYGPLGTVAGIMMWFYVTAFAVLLGAELNSELELQTARDSTDGPPQPLGERGAYVADHVASD